MSKKELIEKLGILQGYGDKGRAAEEGVGLLLEYIGDSQIHEAFDQVPQHYGRD